MLFRLYTFTVCFLAPIYFVSFPLFFFGPLSRYSDLFIRCLPWIAAYLLVGLVFLLIHLWRSKLKTEGKIIWTCLVFCIWPIAWPIYWFKFVWKDAPPPLPGVKNG